MWKINWHSFVEDLKGIPSIVEENETVEPSSDEEVTEIENEIGIDFPPKFRRFLLESSSHINVAWSLEDNALIQLKGERESISDGYFLFNLDEIGEMNYILQESWEPDSYESEYQPDNLLVFADVPNGDQFGVVLSGPDADCIKFLSHDIEDIHLYKVGNDIESFLENYARIGFAGPEFWIWEQFTNKRTTPIDCKSQNAVDFIDAVRNGKRSLEAEEEYRKTDEAMRKMQYEKYVLPKAEQLIQKKDSKGFVRLLSEYTDLMSGAVKKRYEYYIKKENG